MMCSMTNYFPINCPSDSALLCSVLLRNFVPIIFFRINRQPSDFSLFLTSGGQRSRVALAAVSYTKPHVLFLDEPTNNLDLESVAALAQSIKSFEGAIVVVSHDQFFVTEVADEAWVVNLGAVKRVESFEAYRKKQLAKLNKK